MIKVENTHTTVHPPPNCLSNPGKYAPWFFLSDRIRQQAYFLVGYVITNSSICAKFYN